MILILLLDPEMICRRGKTDDNESELILVLTRLDKGFLIYCHEQVCQKPAAKIKLKYHEGYLIKYKCAFWVDIFDTKK